MDDDFEVAFELFFFFLSNVKREGDKNPIKDQCPKPS
jgi:hypothetical protein